MIWLGVVFLILVMLWLPYLEYQHKQSRSVEEYETALKNQEIIPKALHVGFLELEKFTKPNLQAAIEFVNDEKEGQTQTGEKEIEN